MVASTSIGVMNTTVRHTKSELVLLLVCLFSLLCSDSNSMPSALGDPTVSSRPNLRALMAFKSPLAFYRCIISCGVVFFDGTQGKCGKRSKVGPNAK